MGVDDSGFIPEEAPIDSLQLMMDAAEGKSGQVSISFISVTIFGRNFAHKMTHFKYT
jgi:hypothetical protein